MTISQTVRNYFQDGDTPTGTQFSEMFDTLGLVFNPKDPAYGAKGDGSTDDTTAIQATIGAIDATNITFKVNVGTASVTGGATARLTVWYDVRGP